MISEFFEDSEIFITGGSGVVGKALIDKLLRSCNVRKIYVLLRPKKNVSIDDRLQKIKKTMLFRRLHREKPNEFDEKICIVPGDVTQPMLGITPEYAKLMENVTAMFHSAATVRFDESLRDAIKLNVGGTLESIKFAETLKNLKIFLYVSTFYSNPYLERVDPKWYSAPMDWKFCLELIKRNDIPEEMLDTITKKLIVGFPNTYCFTKNLAEALVNDYRDRLPVAIFRPSIVVFAIDDPEPGYSPSLIGAMGLFALAGAGIVKCIYISKDQRLDMSPQDMCIKSMMYDTVKAANLYAKERPAEIPVYLVTSSTHSKITFREYIRITARYKFWIKIPYEKNFLIPGIICTEYRMLYKLVIFVKQILPALLMDGILIMCGRRPELMRLQRKVYTMLETMQPFMFNNYDSPGSTYAKEMVTEMRGTDFNQDIFHVCGNYFMNVAFVRDMIISIREVLLKENPRTLPRARKIMRVKIILYRLIQITVAYKAIGKAISLATNWLNMKNEQCENLNGNY